MNNDLAAILRNGLNQMQLSVSESAQTKLLAYLALLMKWNKTYNLVAKADANTLLNRHILDSLALLPAIHGERMGDIGSGAGLPGIPLAIAQEALSVTLIEPREKRCLFLSEVKRQLNLANVEIAQCRVEDYTAEPLFSMLTCRALSDLAEFIRASAHCLRSDGVFVAMKGPGYREEVASALAQADLNLNLDEVVEYQVPGVDGVRTLLRLHQGNQDVS